MNSNPHVCFLPLGNNQHIYLGLVLSSTIPPCFKTEPLNSPRVSLVLSKDLKQSAARGFFISSSADFLLCYLSVGSFQLEAHLFFWMLFSEEKPAHSHFDSGQKGNCTSYEKSTSVVSEVPPVLMAVTLAYPVATRGIYFLTKPLNLSKHSGVFIRRQALEGKAKHNLSGTGVCCGFSMCAC